MSQYLKIESTEYKAQTYGKNRHKKYNTIGFDKRKELIRRIVKYGEKLKEVSKSLGIKLSTCKFILKIFKRQGRIFKKKSQGCSDTDSQILELKETLEQNIKKNVPVTQYVYVPVYIPIYLTKQNDRNLNYAPQQNYWNANFNFRY